jgi:hypothetical protein
MVLLIIRQVTISEQLRLLPERRALRRATLHGAQVSAGASPEIAEIAGAERRHGAVLEVSPDALDWVELGSVGARTNSVRQRRRLFGIAAPRFFSSHLARCPLMGRGVRLAALKGCTWGPAAAQAPDITGKRRWHGFCSPTATRFTFCFLVRIARLSRSRARPVGRCTLQPSYCSCRPTED